MDRLTGDERAALNAVSEKVIGAAIEVHKYMGPGKLEAIYEECLCIEFEIRGIPYRRQVDVPLNYKGRPLRQCYRIDVLAGDGVIVELKAVEALHPVNDAKLLSALRLSGHRLGLLINFNTVYLVDGVRRLIDRY